jgi:hypothetical protein
MSTSAKAETGNLAIALGHAGSLLGRDPALAEHLGIEILKLYPE